MNDAALQVFIVVNGLLTTGLGLYAIRQRHESNRIAHKRLKAAHKTEKALKKARKATRKGAQA